jgi:hypothetical protein
LQDVRHRFHRRGRRGKTKHLEFKITSVAITEPYLRGK